MFYCVGLGPPDDPSLQRVKQFVGMCNCVLFIINIYIYIYKAKTMHISLEIHFYRLFCLEQLIKGSTKHEIL